MILWFIKILRLFCAFLDKIAYTLISLVYELFMLISQAGIFSQATIQEFAARIYVFLGLIMVFKVSISLVTYILNPDNFNKSDVGAPALLKGFAFSLIGIVLVPYVFEAAYGLQNIVLKDNLIGNLIMGMSDDNNSSDDYIQHAGNDMSFVTLTAFIRLDTQFPQISEACAANPVDVEAASVYGDSPTGNLSANCDGLVDVIGQDAVDLLIKAYANRSITYLTDGDLLNVTSEIDNKDEFVMNYLPIVSTAAGLFIAYVLLLFCVDIAVRSVKLGFLQLIAPIPLIAKVDPKKGGKIFDNWMKECISTYLDVFLRLAAIYFVLFIISAITTSGNSGIYNIVTGNGFSGISGIFVKIFIIIGALNFARDLPKLLGKILGIDFKGMGGFSLNPMKNKNLAPLGAAAGLGTGFAAGLANGGGLAGGFAGGIGGVGRGLMGAMSGKTAGDILKNQSGVNLHRRMNPETTLGGRLLSNAQGMLGIPDASQRAEIENHKKDRTIMGIDTAIAENDDLLARLEREKEPLKDKQTSYNDMLGMSKGAREEAQSQILKNASNTSYSQDMYNKKNMIDTLRSQAANISRDKYGSDADYQAALSSNASAISSAESDYNKSLQDSINSYINDVAHGSTENAAITSTLDAMNQRITAHSDYEGYASGVIDLSGDVASQMKTIKDTVSDENSNISKTLYQADLQAAPIKEAKQSLTLQKQTLESEKKALNNSRAVDVAKQNKQSGGGK